MFTGNSYVGRTIADFEKTGLVAAGIGTKALPNGKFEKEYVNLWMREVIPGTRDFIYQCHFFMNTNPNQE